MKGIHIMVILLISASLLSVGTLATNETDVGYVSDGFDGNELDSTNWVVKENINYHVSDGTLKIPLNTINGSFGGILSKEMNMSTEKLHFESSYTIDVTGVQENDTESAIYFTLSFFNQTAINQTSNGDNIIFSGVGFSRDDSVSELQFMTGSNEEEYSQHTDRRMYGGEHDLFGKDYVMKSVIDFVYDTNGVEYVSSIYVDDTLVVKNVGTVQNVSDIMVVGVLVYNDTPINGDVSIDYIKIGHALTESPNYYYPLSTVEMDGVLLLSLALLLVAVSMWVTRFIEEKHKYDQILFAKMFTMAGMLLGIYYLYGNDVVVFGGVPLWALALFFPTLLVLYWDGKIGRKKTLL